MALTLTSTLAGVETELRRIDADAHVGKDEFKILRKLSDQRMLAVVPPPVVSPSSVVAPEVAAPEVTNVETAAPEVEAVKPPPKKKPRPDLPTAARQLQASADDLVEAMRWLAIGLRGSKAFDDRREALREAMEYQIGYVVSGYQWAMEQVRPVDGRDDAVLPREAADLGTGEQVVDGASPGIEQGGQEP